MIYLTLAELLHVAERVIDGDVKVRDVGLLDSALARPRASAFGQDAYQDLDEKPAALLHSLARNDVGLAWIGFESPLSHEDHSSSGTRSLRAARPCLEVLVAIR